MTDENAKHQIIKDILKAIDVLKMLKKSHKKAEMEHFQMVIEDLEQIIKNIEKDI